LPRRQRRPSPATVFFALLSLALGIALYLKTRPKAEAPEAPRAPEVPTHTPPPHRPAPTRGAARASPPPAATAATRAHPALAILIDDLGNELAPARRIASWPEPVSGAVLPGLAFSAASARALSESGKQVLLHLPMEPEGFPRVRPGPGVILRAQSDGEIARILEEDLATVPGAAGVNNHMGSAATADPRVMRAVVRVLSRRGLFFVDSRTTDATVAERTAEEESVPSARRRVFLDDVATEAAVRAQLDDAVAKAKAEGGAIAIGHPYPATLSVLEKELPNLGERGVRLVKVGELVK
jgi:polysaccharide deacetylase 2 family uncharacterized protein YibQ